MKRRFVILEHTIGPAFSRDVRSVPAGPVHWDWLFESTSPQSLLSTWATEPLNRTAFDSFALPNGEFAATRLKDHRHVYLEFEGDIGRERGHVRQIARGTFSACVESETEFEAVLRFDASVRTGVRPTDARLRFAYSDSSNPSPDAITLWIASSDSSEASWREAIRYTGPDG